MKLINLVIYPIARGFGMAAHYYMSFCRWHDGR